MGEAECVERKGKELCFVVDFAADAQESEVISMRVCGFEGIYPKGVRALAEDVFVDVVSDFSG